MGIFAAIVLEWVISPLALLVALLLLAVVVVGLVVSSTRTLSAAKGLTSLTGFTKLSLWVVVGLAVLFVSGTLVSLGGAAVLCNGWPLCAPQNALGWLALLHRAAVGLAGLLIALQFARAWQTQRSQAGVLTSATAAAVLFVSQALLGRGLTHDTVPYYLTGLHVATSAAVWVTAVLTLTLSARAQRSAEEEAAEAREFAARKPLRMLADLLLLTKPIVVALLLVTTYAGMVIGARAFPAWDVTLWTLLGGFLAAGGSGAINQYIDRNDDGKMQRTQKRPIPAGRMQPAEGLAFGVGIGLLSFYLLTAWVNFLAALLSLAGIFYYVVLYSLLLKKTTVQNIVIGGGAGALPPLVGWAAATGSLTFPSLLLFAVVFMWTPPHFWALAIVRKHDYARAGVPMLPVVRGELETRWQVFLYTLELVALTLLLPLFGLGQSIYLIAAGILGLWLIGAAYRVWKGEGNKVAWKMYRYSSMYLAFLFVALMIDRLVL
ncbi:MAG: hypothetical protein OHK0052_10440 [Anaerolineales bacterium]